VKSPSVGAQKRKKTVPPSSVSSEGGGIGSVRVAFSVVVGPALVLVLRRCWDWRRCWCWRCLLSVVLDAGVVCCSWCQRCLLSVVFGVVRHLGRLRWHCCDVGVAGALVLAVCRHGPWHCRSTPRAVAHGAGAGGGRWVVRCCCLGVPLL
jgi:hypothetical protein